MRFLYLLFILTFFYACKTKPIQEGDSMMNYPDMELIYKDYFIPIQNSNNQFLKIEYKENKKDSSVLNANNMDWNYMHSLFTEANLYDKKFDKTYSISIIQDTLDPLMTLIYTSLDKNNLVQKLNIKATVSDNKINSIYWETLKHGFMSKEEKKILYVVDKTIQIQEYNKKPLSDPSKTVIQYNIITATKDSM